MNNEITFHIQSAPFWDWRVALDLFLGGAGVGAFLFAVLIDEWFKGKYQRICRTAAWLSPFLVGAGLSLVLLKMGRPLHLFLTYTNFNPTAPLWWGGIFQPLMVVGGTIYAFMWVNRQQPDPVRKWVGRLLSPLALVVGGYHGMLLSLMVARPIWNTGPTVLAALLGFASTGIAVVMLVHLFRMKRGGRLADENHVAAFLDDMRVVRNSLMAVLTLQLGTAFLWWQSLKYGNLQDQQALLAANESYGFMAWWLGMGLGVLLPLGLGAITVLRGETRDRRLQITMIGLTSVLILAGGVFFRFALVLGGQSALPVAIGF